MSKKEFTFSLDERLANKATELFEQLGMTLDSAVNIFISQAVLRRGLPFQIVMPENADAQAEPKKAEPEEKQESQENSQADEVQITKTETAETESTEQNQPAAEKNESAQAEEPNCNIQETEQQREEEVSFVTPEIAARVAANEALVAEMRGSLESSDCTPEFEENEEAELAKKQGIVSEAATQSETKPAEEKQESVAEKPEIQAEPVLANDSETSAEKEEPVDEDEEEDQNLPDNIFDCWELDENVGSQKERK